MRYCVLIIILNIFLAQLPYCFHFNFFLSGMTKIEILLQSNQSPPGNWTSSFDYLFPFFNSIITCSFQYYSMNKVIISYSPFLQLLTLLALVCKCFLFSKTNLFIGYVAWDYSISLLKYPIKQLEKPYCKFHSKEISSVAKGEGAWYKITWARSVLEKHFSRMLS